MQRLSIYNRMLETMADDPGRSRNLVAMIESLKKEFPGYNFDEDRYIAYWFFSHTNAPINYCGRF